MAATNSTTNLGLPQWEATDKPERTDFNTAMSDIDTNLNLVQEKQVFKGALVKRTTNQELVSAEFTTLSWEVEDYDTDGFFSSGQPTRFTVPAGINKIKLFFCGSFSADLGEMSIRVAKNGSAHFESFYYRTQSSAAAALNAISLSSPAFSVSEGDYFEVQVSRSSSTTGRNFISALANYFAIEVIE